MPYLRPLCLTLKGDKMRSHKNYCKPLFLILTLSLASYSQAQDPSSPEYLGKSNARLMNTKVHSAYLQCYPLDGKF